MMMMMQMVIKEKRQVSEW
jgi:hypothetical protein